MQKMSKTHIPTSFGVFKPVGHLVLAFRAADTRDQVMHVLAGQGFGDEDLTAFEADEWLDTMDRAEANRGLMATFGSELDQVEMHARLARDGHVFLVVFAPAEAQTEAVAEVAERYGAVLVQKYGRLLIENKVLRTDDSRVAPEHFFGVSSHALRDDEVNNEKSRENDGRR
ncbi:hypothetical protein [Chitinimonas koreensis]|uniref:hypothetical protein n=1 Tax=Chitinimonas koreensis TaxID=356302 RepID=UPI000556DBF0|nr:hypothetical protein [Chitinimonas koreensis]QNM95663.1 hypothetical protein H9L41_17650 [Chitinimonas koreensis]